MECDFSLSTWSSTSVLLYKREGNTSFYWSFLIFLQCMWFHKQKKIIFITMDEESYRAYQKRTGELHANFPYPGHKLVHLSMYKQRVMITLCSYSLTFISNLENCWCTTQPHVICHRLTAACQKGVVMVFHSTRTKTKLFLTGYATCVIKASFCLIKL